MALHLNMHTITEFDKLLNIRLSINTKAFNTKKYIFTPIKKKRRVYYSIKLRQKKLYKKCFSQASSSHLASLRRGYGNKAKIFSHIKGDKQH